MSKLDCKIGDLVHIPQAVELIDVHQWAAEDPQLAIPLRVDVTEGPTIGVVTHKPSSGHYLRVFCEGDMWSVKDDSVYALKKED
jgi:hypothetical protein